MANKTSWTPGFVDTMNLGSENRALKERKTQINQAFSNQFNQIKNPQLDPTRANYQTYPYDYFSGSNAKIFFGDVWVDDIINIQYNITQSKTPIYGYASQNYDAVALGTIIVQGSLAIAFKETGYLNVIQYLLEAQAQNYNKAIQYTTALNVAEANAKLGKYIPGFSEGDPREMTGVVYGANGAPQIIRQQETIENILMSKKDNLVSQGLSKTIGLGNSSVGRDFEDFAEVLEDTIWGDSNGKPIGLGGVLRRADEFDYIYSSNSNETPVGVKVPRGNDYSKALNILLTFGDLNDFRAEHTLISLNDIHFQSQGLICSANGEPLAEMYNFFARDINKSINKKGSFKIDPIKFDFGSTETISKLEDVKKVEDYLNNNSAALIITLLSGLNKVDNIGWKSQNKVIDKVPFYKKEYEPILDQIIKITEQTINDTKNNVSTKYTQLAISVEPTNQKGLEKEASKINMILSQSVPNTLTFRVIAPTRSNFNAVSIISREDIFKDVPQANNMKDMKALAEEAVTQSIQKRNESAKNAITQANTKSAKIESELTDLATDKINQEIQKEQDKVNKYSSGEVSARDMRKIEEAEANIARLETQKQNVNSNNLSVLDSSKLTDYEQAQYNSLLEQQNIVNAQKEQSQTLVSNIETYQNKKETAEFNKLTSEIAKEKETLLTLINDVGSGVATKEQEEKIDAANEKLQRLELERENNNTEFEIQSEIESSDNTKLHEVTGTYNRSQITQERKQEEISQKALLKDSEPTLIKMDPMVIVADPFTTAITELKKIESQTSPILNNVIQNSINAIGELYTKFSREVELFKKPDEKQDFIDKSAEMILKFTQDVIEFTLPENTSDINAESIGFAGGTSGGAGADRSIQMIEELNNNFQSLTKPEEYHGGNALIGSLSMQTGGDNIQDSIAYLAWSETQQKVEEKVPEFVGPPAPIVTEFKITVTPLAHLERDSNPAYDYVATTNYGEKVAVTPFDGIYTYNPTTKTSTVKINNQYFYVVAHQDAPPNLNYGQTVKAGDIVGINVWDTGKTADFTGLHSHAWIQTWGQKEDGTYGFIDVPIKEYDPYKIIKGLEDLQIVNVTPQSSSLAVNNLSNTQETNKFESRYTE